MSRDYIVRFHVQRGDLFFGDDRHGPMAPMWVPFDSPVVCAWDTAIDADRYARAGFADRIRISVDGELLP
jgi:hypothetical protein